MIGTIEEVVQASSWDEMREKLGEYLGLPQAVSSAVLQRALHDDKFAYYLVTWRHRLDMVQLLLNDKKNQQYEQKQEREEKSSTELVVKASGALLKWGKSGFAKLDEEVYERRWSACNSCEYLVEPPDQIVYKITIGKKTDKRVCSACGCVASRKAKLPTERCPVTDPLDASVNKWGQPIEQMVH